MLEDENKFLVGGARYPCTDTVQIENVQYAHVSNNLFIVR